MSDAPDVGELSPPNRTLMGPGPSDVHPRVLRAMSTPLVGHLDPSFVELMDEVQELLRYTFRTDNEWTIPVSGTGSAAMEAAIGNVVEPGDTMLVPTNGYFGGRMAEMAERAGGDVVEVDAPWGEPLDPDDVAAAFDAHDVDVFGFVHAETSTGVLQPEVPALTSIAHDHDALVIADTVTSIGGVELRVDEWDVDVAYAGPQKCLSCPPGASPLTLNDEAMEKVLNREADARSWYLDLSLLEGYWGEERAYHHTAPITNVYAIREALRLVAEEDIEERWARHRRVAGALKAGLEAMGLEMNAPEEYWLPSLNAVRVPDGVDDGEVIDYLLDAYDLEIASGLGDLEGDIWRIGCMGYSANPKNVSLVVSALGDALARQGVDVDVGAAVEATARELEQ
ncbi:MULTISPECIES: pyridoxal-phosphate-dependent aminotransferase family protein [Halolamina]|uniref:Alanine-glyoxylate transaminase / serine-glyoxylate transaminase / serine-pyruvate transaminase n=1 Tax=Halolamina pelagica TaxID=699431 RepID=A0A1I5QZJ3_9EURY|nr:MULTISPECIES: alanine--glyoxylate aminotransferase family protein [Halolamina]NHX35615.1 alanine--glyoxylate aminotransferase family protein [Halolamina sp. R1-12]SFP51688.1 alanine-glyoxylate transaminase / serine-glyoxylate transaminase / serine-pyruvate transaminase [Halolamina pelagica]